ncbi:MAG: response regulator [Leptospiraceae bacterium]|nr:response regulator [Leptospiraceae bacterium]MCP5497446.1 response regulator [Leptospiraceae bacterium]
MKKFISCIIGFLLLTLPSCNLKFTPKIQPIAKNGILDLRNWDFHQNGLIQLKGEWEFYWEKFYLETDFQRENIQKNYFINIPSTWNGMKVGNTILKGDGFATIHLKVLLNKSVSPETILSVRTNLQMTACEIYANGIKLPGSGIVGKSPAEHKPDTLPTVGFVITPKDHILSIILHISNFNHRKGGVFHPIYLGTAYDIFELMKKKDADIFLMGILFIIIFYHIGLFVIRQKDLTPLLFALFCLDIFLRTASTDDKLITIIFPGIPYKIYAAIEYITFFLSAPLGIHFLHKIFPKEIHFKIVKVFYIISFGFCLFPLTTPINIYSHTVNIYLVIFIFSIVIGFVFNILAIIRNRDYSHILFFGFLSVIVTSVNDILNTTEVLNTGYIAHYGLAVMVFSQSIVLSIKFSRAFSEVEILSEELHKNKITLENKVEQRTEELKKAKEKAEKANQLKDKFISLISHDLKSPIIGVCNLLDIVTENRFQNKEDKTKAIEYIKDSKSILMDSLRMLENLLNINRLQTGKYKLIYKQTNIYQLVNVVFSKIFGQSNTKNISLINNVTKEFCLIVDSDLFEQVILNLVSNAIKFSRQDGSVTISYFEDSENHTIVVQDNGVGIDERDIPNLFSTEIKTSRIGTSGEKGTGLGLPFCKDIIETHNGKIEVKSKIDEGSSFYIKIPKTNFIVLMAEDNQDSADKIKNILQSEKILVIHSQNGEDAIYSLFNILPNLIVTDMNMPIMNGMEFIQELKKNPEWSIIPIIAMSLDLEKNDLNPDKLYQLGVNEFIKKPISKEELLKSVFIYLKDIKKGTQ